MPNSPVDDGAFLGTSRQLIEGSGVYDVPTYRTKILKRIHELEKEITELKEAFNAVSPIHRLPVEILTTIFAFVSQFPTGSEILRASQVCKSWRTIALDLPHLWSDLRGSCLVSEKLTKVMLEKSREAPLTLSCPGSRITEIPLDPHAVSAVLSQISRLKSVTLCNTDYDDGETVDLPKVLSDWPAAHAPILEHLCIMNIVDDDYYSSGFAPPSWEALEDFQLDDGLLGSGAPALRDLTLSHIGIPWSNLPLGANLVQLRLLEEPSFGDYFRPIVPTFIQSLRKMPLLETLELHGFLPREDDAYCGQRHTFPPALKTLKITDSSDLLSQFFQIVTVPDHVSIIITFIQDEIDVDNIDLVLGHLKASFSQKRAAAGVQKLTERRASTCFDLHFNDLGLPMGVRGLEGYLGQLSIDCGTEPTPNMEAHEYYSALTRHFDLSTLRSLKYSWVELDYHEDLAWSYLRGLRSLETVTLSDSQFSPFLNQLESDPMLSSTGDVQSEKMCYFPAVTTINCVSSSFLGFDDTTHEGCLESIVQVFNTRLQLGAPLPTISFDEEEISEDDAKYVREGVPGLVVHRLARGAASRFE